MTVSDCYYASGPGCSRNWTARRYARPGAYHVWTGSMIRANYRLHLVVLPWADCQAKQKGGSDA